MDTALNQHKLLNDLVNALSSNLDIFNSILPHLPIALRRWKPNIKTWSILEIICHLYDVEIEGYRYKIEHALNNHGIPLIKTDFKKMSSSKQYIKKNYNQTLKIFLYERQQSLTWLNKQINSLPIKLWNHNVKYLSHQKKQQYNIPIINLLANWPAHDYLHIQQIYKIKFEYLQDILHDPLNNAKKN